MSALLRQGAAKMLGGSLQVQRARAAVPEERRRLGSRFIHTKEGAREDITSQIQRKKEGEKSRCQKWRERQLQFERFDAEFTKILKTAFGMYMIYAVLDSRDVLDELQKARNDKKSR